MIRKSKKNSLLFATVATISLLAWWSQAEDLRTAGRYRFTILKDLLHPQDTTKTDTSKTQKYIPSRRPTFEPSDRYGTPFSGGSSSSPLLLGQPSNVQLNVELDDSLQQYNITETIGGIHYRPPSSMTMREFSEWQQRQAVREYWRAKSAGLDGESVMSSNRLIPKLYISPVFDRIFGGNYVDIQPNGNIALKFGARFNRNQNPTIPLRQQSTGDFDFEQNISLNLVGKIGEKMRLNFNWDNNANFDFENNMKLDYTGYEEEIIRKVEAGNVSLPLNNSLITGAQNLFGVKTQLQFGRLAVTTIASSVRGTNDEVIIQNGAQNRPFSIRVDQYDKDRHFFLSQFFRGRYNNALKNLPLINSGIVIRRLELYVTNSNRSTENLRNMVAYMDLAEPDPYRDQFGNKPASAPADNAANTLYSQVARNNRARSNAQVDEYLRSQGLEKGVDFEHVRARKLDPREYKFNQQLGYISLNTALLPDQVLGVAFEYTYNGKTYQVGELIDDYQNLDDEKVIHMKLLRATNPSLQLPTWDLMMKNVYSLDATQLNREDFKLQIIYKDDETGVDITSIKEPSPIQNIPLVEVLNLDNVNSNNDKPSDGNFDFIPGTTIDPETGRIFFPQVEPFGDYLAQKLEGRPDLIEKYVFQELYDQTQTDAQQNNIKAKFYLQGRFQATSADEIMLPGFQIAEGSVVVYSGGTRLVEGTDYQVFYDMGRIKILNPSYLNAANDLRVTYEKAELMNIQPRSMLGARFDYRLNDDVNLGATMLHINEQAYINRVSIGDEPTNNTIYGFDVNMQKESRFLTKMTDALPFVETKVPSFVTFSGEIAQLVPGTTKSNANEDGASYIDDFEGSETPYSLGGFNNTSWRLAATPAPLVPGPGLAYSYNRAKIAWYTIDQIFYRDADNLRPKNITKEELQNHYVRGVWRNEVFPGRDAEITNSYEYTFDIAYYPSERGQYNYNPELTSKGLLAGDPRKNWGGISRDISFDTDFDNANIEYVEFWLMDPFITGKNGRKDAEGNEITRNEGGELVLNLGSVSEDILRDNQYAFENGLPTSSNDMQDLEETLWGRVTSQQFLTDAFTGIPGARKLQDIGLDGLDNASEVTYFQNSFLNQIPGTPPQVVLDDPSADNFLHHLDPVYDQRSAGILARYKNFNGMEGNSPESSRFSSYAFPDKEDLNRDNVISDLEQYYEYKINLKPGQLEIGQNYIVDAVKNEKNGATWYQFRIPVRQPTNTVGNISGFKSVRFMRMYLTQFADPVVLRFVQFQFVANQWRKYEQPITDGSPCLTCTDDAKSFTVSTVNVEENSQAIDGTTPYRVPPGIERLRDYSSTNNRRQNEQSLQLCVEDLKDTFSKAVYKNISLDMLIYKQLKMYIHAESSDPATRDGDVQAFIRIGTDFTQNYYEYVVPLKLTPKGSNSPYDVWPAENEIAIALQDFVDTKMERNLKPGYPLYQAYERQLGNGKIIRVIGNPDFSEVEGVMIGLRNPRVTNDDARPHSVCMWADELRVTDFRNQTGWASNARLNAKLADFANVTATGAYTTVGFGGLQQKIAQRARENTALFDVNANVVLDKLLPETWGVKVPLTVQYGVMNSEPQYDPLDKDVPLKQSLTKFDNDEQRAAYRKEVTTQETRRSISLLNVRKERTNPEAKAQIYDIENFSLSYSYAERLFSNIETDRDYSKTYMGSLAYTYNNTPKNYTPFANAEGLNSPYLRLVKDFNFSLVPSRFAFRADLNRFYNETFLQRPDPETRFVTTRGINPTFQKNFYFNRIYDMRWDLTKSLSLDYTANTRAVIDEPNARIDKEIDSLAYKNKEIWNNLKQGGRTTSFNQIVALNYQLPFDKFPLTDWISTEARYAATYTWTAGSTALNQAADFKLGNTAENSTEISANGRIDMVKLYNKVRFLKDVNSPAPVRPAAANDTTAKKPDMKFLKSLARLLMMTRSINVTYLENRGTMLPGYLPTPSFFGFDDAFDAPGLPFILGKQYDLDQLYASAYLNGWYTDSSQYLNNPFSALNTKTFTARANLEPVRNLNIQVDARRTTSIIDEVFYRKEYDDFGEVGMRDERQNPFTSGSFSTSFLALGTMFESTESGISDAFEHFVRYRHNVREKLSLANPAAADSGYSLNSQEVLMKSFLYAYQGRDINGYQAKNDNPFSRLPIPNWRIDYNGLERLPVFQKWFSQISLSHGYNSSYNITSFSTSLAYNQEPTGFPTARNEFGQIEPYYIVNQLTVVERLAPLLGVNFRTISNFTGRIEYKMERNLSLNLTNAQVTETSVKDYVVGFGYSTSNFKLPFKFGGERIVLDNELTMRLDFSVRDNQTVQRAISRDDAGVERSQNQIINGSRQLQLRPTIDYVLSQRLNLQFYVLRTVSEPKISTSFRNSVTEGGIQLRVSLQ
ncbi:cell surface protein SprA [Pontibacter ummariensis]|uniref:Cell surface protein SprA n=1 Tax=Pontibacter ummariensis TaxID=1610492 RepID=A0A239HTE4_9BACT|nr:cell surface protein SprA [Pontibacter ummariensis]PRY10431.1 cell surface protein SprA [Pontibacter ummariensis]SNS84630.1 cell surface protein SprA [Pontibacter ummariensis]